MKRLYDIKKDDLFATGAYNLVAHDELDTIVGTYKKDEELLAGVFSFKGKTGNVDISGTGIEDGKYKNLINDEKVLVSKGHIDISNAPVIIKKTVQ